MAAARVAQGTRRLVLGKALLILGGFFLLGQTLYLCMHAVQYWHQTGLRGDLIASLGMALVHVVNTVAWAPAAALASVVTVLVSCWPLLLIVAGIVLLIKNAARG